MTPRQTPVRAPRALAALLGAWLCAALPGEGATPTPAAVMKSWSDVTAFGAVGDGQTDCAAAFQKAHDALAATVGATGYGTVYVPQGAYRLGREVWLDRSRIVLRGDGPGSRLIAGTKRSPVVAGVKRNDGKPVDASHRPDLYGTLDALAVPGPGQRYGVATQGDAFLQLQHHALVFGTGMSQGNSYPDHYSQVRALTIEACFAPPPGTTWPGDAPLFGLGLGWYEPAPWHVAMYKDQTGLSLTFKTADMDPRKDSGRHQVIIPLAGTAPPYRLVIVIDLDAGAVNVWLGGAKVATRVSTTGAKPFGPGLTFLPNEVFPFLVGAEGINGTDHGRDSTPINLYGLRVSRGARYSDASPPKRDDTAYFTVDGTTLGLFPFDDRPPAAPAPCRTVDVENDRALASGGRGTAFLINARNTGDISVSDLVVRDIALEAAPGGQPALAVGNIWGLELDHVSATGGLQGVGSFNGTVTYPVSLDHCTLSGSECAYYGFQQLMTARSTYVRQGGRDAIRLQDSCSHWYDTFHAFAAPSWVANTVYSFPGGDYGGVHILDNSNIDMEGDTVQTAIIAAVQYWQMSTVLEVNNLQCGTVGPNAAIIKLKHLGNPGQGGWNAARIAVRNLTAFTNTYAAAVAVDGPAWFGDLDLRNLGGPPFLYTGPGTANVTVRGKGP